MLPQGLYKILWNLLQIMVRSVLLPACMVKKKAKKVQEKKQQR